MSDSDPQAGLPLGPLCSSSSKGDKLKGVPGCLSEEGCQVKVLAQPCGPRRNRGRSHICPPVCAVVSPGPGPDERKLPGASEVRLH